MTKESDDFNYEIDGQRFVKVFTWCMLLLFSVYSLYVTINLVPLATSGQLTIEKSDLYNRATAELFNNNCENKEDCLYLLTNDYAAESAVIVRDQGSVIYALNSLLRVLFFGIMVFVGLTANLAIKARGKK